MSPLKDTNFLRELLTILDVATLGEGDPIAGANLLAAMACSIANIARPGSGLVTADGRTLAVGSSLMVSGSFSSSLITERVLSGLGIRQNNMVSHIRSRERTIKDEYTETASMMEREIRAASQNAGGAQLKKLYGPPQHIDDKDVQYLWRQVLQSPAQSDFRDLLERHLIFVTGTTAAQVERQLQRSHLGRPFLHLGVDQTSDFGRWQHLCPAVMDGRHTAGSMSGSIRGTVVVTDPSELLGEVVLTDTPSARWVSRMPWLVDGIAGPEPDGAVESEENKQPVALDNLEARFEAAMSSAWLARVNNLSSSPVTVSSEYRNVQARWIAFLKTMEPTLPGITGSARSLFVTLMFGLNQMVAVEKAPEGFRWSVNQVAALAQLLIRRMANARAVMLLSAETARKRRLETSLLCKLADGPQNVRSLTRRSRGMTSVQCRELLLDLEAVGRVTCCGDDWKLSAAEEAAFISATDTTQLAIDARA